LCCLIMETTDREVESVHQTAFDEVEKFSRQKKGESKIENTVKKNL